MTRMRIGLTWLLAVLGLACSLSSPARGHEIRPGMLDMTETSAGWFDVTWKVPMRGDLILGIRPVLPESLVVVGPPAIRRVPGAAIQRFTCKAEGEELAGETIFIDGLSTMQIDVLVRIHRLDGRSQTVRLTPANPRLTIDASPSVWQLSGTYLLVGIQHILLGVDHLLFVFGLLLIVAGRWRLFKTITAFTIAHSITLAIATFGYARAPVAPLNAAIALSILFLGPEIVRVWRGETSLTIRKPWLVAFAFGLLHGFGFASGLADLGVTGGEMLVALLAFNIGVELGQIGFVLLILALAWSFRVLAVHWPAWVRLAPGYAVGSLGAFWTIQRVAVLFGTRI
jgi:hypothetical protein